jgi:hypothetical protein
MDIGACYLVQMSKKIKIARFAIVM